MPTHHEKDEQKPDLDDDEHEEKKDDKPEKIFKIGQGKGYSTTGYLWLSKLETDSKKPGQDQKLTTSKKSAIFELSSWNLVKMTNLMR